MIIELESCFNMTRDEAIAIADADPKTRGAKVYIRHCECRACGGPGEALGHWFHPPWVIEVADVLNRTQKGKVMNIAQTLQAKGTACTGEDCHKAGGKWDDDFAEFRFPDGSTGRFVDVTPGYDTRDAQGDAVLKFVETLDRANGAKEKQS